MFLRLCRRRSVRNDQIVHFAFVETRTSLFEGNEREGEPRNVIAVLEEAAQIVETRDFRRQDQRLGLAVEHEVAPGARAVIVRFAQPLDLDLADGLTDPLCRAWLGRAKKDFGCWL